MRLMQRGPRKPPVAKINREGSLRDDTWLFPDRRFDQDHQLEIAGPAVCARCHAYLETDHWRYGEARYNDLRVIPGVTVTLCPGCTRVERRLYEGEVVVQHDWAKIARDEVLNLIHNEEARVRVANPTARIALIEDRDDTLYILTTTVFLAERLGKALQKSFHGSLRLSKLPRERFVRVWWAL
jgi:hypothetical protein